MNHFGFKGRLMTWRDGRRLDKIHLGLFRMVQRELVLHGMIRGAIRKRFKS